MFHSAIGIAANRTFERLVAGLEIEFGQAAAEGLARQFIEAEDGDFAWEARHAQRWLGCYESLDNGDAFLDRMAVMGRMRQTYASFQAKSDELGQLKSFFGRYDQLLIDRQTKKSEIEAERLLLQASVSAAAEGLRSFEKTILAIHQFIQGSKKASFEVRVTNKKQVVEIVLRIDDDGSHSVEREKVFIYDVALMLNDYTRSRHPGLLVHDNIFDVDDDTLQRSLEYILTRASWGDGQQYILTLNVDRLEHCRDEPWFYELEQNVVATFTKSQRFLKSHYQELG